MARKMKVLVLHRPSGPRGGDTLVADQFTDALKHFDIEAESRGADNIEDARLFDFVHIFAAVDVSWGLDVSVTLQREGVPYTITPFYYPRDERQKYFGQYGDILPGYKETVAYIMENSLSLACVTMGEYRTCLDLIGHHQPGFVMGYGFTPPKYPEFVEPQDFVFQLARVEPHKNQATTALACSVMGIPYICAGVITNSEYAGLIQANGGKVLGEISQEDAMKLMMSARVHANPSFGECIAQVNCEAAYCGTPLVIGLGHDWEYFGDRAEYCDPSDWREIAAAIQRAWRRPRKSWTAQPHWKNAAVRWIEYITEHKLWTG